MAWSQGPGSVVELHSAVWSRAHRAHVGDQALVVEVEAEAEAVEVQPFGEGDVAGAVLLHLVLQLDEAALGRLGHRGERRPELVE